MLSDDKQTPYFENMDKNNTGTVNKEMRSPS